MTPERLTIAKKFWAALHVLTDPVEMLETPRNRAAAASFTIASDHHAAIIVLFEHGLYSSAFALLRVLFEAYLRGAWLKHCATDEQVLAHFKGAEPPRMTTILAQIVASEAVSNELLSGWKRKHWNAMCDFTHTGGQHLQRWQTDAGVEQNFPPDELEACLTAGEVFGSIASLELAQLRKSGDTGEGILELINRRWPASADGS